MSKLCFSSASILLVYWLVFKVVSIILAKIRYIWWLDEEITLNQLISIQILEGIQDMQWRVGVTLLIFLVLNIIYEWSKQQVKTGATENVDKI